jgi:hypothetical protein
MESLDEENEPITDFLMRTERPSIMLAEYSVNLLNGNHGIWLFVSKNGKVVIEQAGIKTVAKAMELAAAVITSEENHEAERKEAEKAQISHDLDGG